MLQDSTTFIAGSQVSGLTVATGIAFPASPTDGQHFRLTTATATYAVGDYYYDASAAEWTNDFVALGKSTDFVAPAKKGAVPAIKAAAAVVIPYDIGIQILGKPDASAVVARFIAVRPYKIAVAMAGSVGKAGVAPTAALVLSVRKNGVEFGTVSFAAGSTTAVFAATALASFAIGDIFTVVAPAVADSTFADTQITFVAALA